MFETNLAIEFGGGFISIYKKNSGLVLKEHSLLAVSKVNGTYKILAMGNDAKNLSKIEDPSINIFSPFAEGKIKSFEYAVLLLKHFLNKVELKKSFLKNLTAVLCVPVGIEQEEKKQFKNLCLECNIEKVSFLPSVYATAYYEGLSEFLPKYRMIVDIGASTTDVAVVNFSGINHGSTLCIGGRSMNAGIYNMMKEKYGITVSMYLAEKIKEELGTLFDNDISTMQVTGISDDGKEKTVTVKAKDVKDVLTPYFNEILKLVEMTLNVCSNDILAEVGRYGIILTGGQTNIAGLEKFFVNRLRIPIRICEENENSTILGAGLLLKQKEVLNKVLI